MHSVIQFLNAKNVHIAKIHRQVVEIYGGSALNKRKVI
jgi:hypothetical protein